jgi:hypothetical protein
VEKKSVQFRLPLDLLKRIEEDAMAEGRERQSGRAYNPSAVVERIIREYYDARPKRPRLSK